MAIQFWLVTSRTVFRRWGPRPSPSHFQTRASPTGEHRSARLMAATSCTPSFAKPCRRLTACLHGTFVKVMDPGNFCNSCKVMHIAALNFPYCALHLRGSIIYISIVHDLSFPPYMAPVFMSRFFAIWFSITFLWYPSE